VATNGLYSTPPGAPKPIVGQIPSIHAAIDGVRASFASTWGETGTPTQEQDEKAETRHAQRS
jgi:hypothetical protein